MGYYTDLNTISLDTYQAKLEKDYVLPSRIILKENTGERFSCFRSKGIKTVLELQQTLKKKEKLLELSLEKCFPEEYLIVLLREINSLQPKPNKLKEFPGISPETVKKLESIGVKDTIGLFDKVKTRIDREKLAKDNQIDNGAMLELAKLTDLSRIRWVGTMFARVLYQAGFDTVEKVAKADYEELYHKIHQLNSEKNLYKGQIGLNDMKLCVQAAKEVSLEIEY